MHLLLVEIAHWVAQRELLNMKINAIRRSAIALFVILVTCEVLAADGEKPNVLFIAVDDLGPSLDAMASKRSFLRTSTRLPPVA